MLTFLTIGHNGTKPSVYQASYLQYRFESINITLSSIFYPKYTNDILILFLQFLSDNVVQPCSGKWSQSRSGPHDKTRPSSILPDGLRLCCGQ